MPLGDLHFKKTKQRSLDVMWTPLWVKKQKQI